MKVTADEFANIQSAVFSSVTDMTEALKTMSSFSQTAVKFLQKAGVAFAAVGAILAVFQMFAGDPYLDKMDTIIGKVDEVKLQIDESVTKIGNEVQNQRCLDDLNDAAAQINAMYEKL